MPGSAYRTREKKATKGSDIDPALVEKKTPSKNENTV
jgi:hypothetical protein